MPRKAPPSNEEVDKKLEGRNIKRLSDCDKSITPVAFECLVCGNVWNTTPSVIYNHGCWECFIQSRRISEDEIEKRLDGRQIKFLEKCENVNNPIKCQCLENNCNHIWTATPHSIFDGHGCPEHAGNARITKEKVDERLLGRNITILTDLSNKKLKTKMKIELQCDVCHNIWKTTFDIIFQGKGCPCCGALANKINNRITKKEIDKRLEGRSIILLDDPNIRKRNKSKLHFQCLKDECGTIWEARLDTIFSGVGCPKCKMNKNSLLVGKILTDNDILFETEKPAKKLVHIIKNKWRVDYYLPEYDTIIEYNGRQHYQVVQFGSDTVENAREKFQTQQIRDLAIDSYCKRYGITIIWINGKEYKGKKLEKYMNDVIIPQILSQEKIDVKNHNQE